MSEFPNEKFPYIHDIHPAPNYPWLSPASLDPVSTYVRDMWRLSTYSGSNTDLLQHLQTFSSVTVVSSKALFHSHQASCVKLIYSLINRNEWTDITLENKVPTLIDLDTELPKETTYIFRSQQHTLSEEPIWNGEDLFLSVANNSNAGKQTIQLDVALTFNMHVVGGFYSLLTHLGKFQSQRTWKHYWTNIVTFERKKPTFLLSLSGKINKVILKNLLECENVSLIVVWIPTFNRKFKQLIDAQPLLEASRGDKFFTGHEYTHQGFVYDWSFEPEWKRYKKKCIAPYAFISYKQKAAFTTLNERVDYSQLKGTWLEAMHLCLKFNGSLPILRSREELDHLLSLFKLPFQTPPPMPLMFIGLIKTQVKL